MNLINNIIGKSLVLLILVLGTTAPILATHIVGGDMTYKCLGNDRYEISLTVRRDCDNGEPEFDDPASVGIFDSDGNIIFELGIAGSLLIPFNDDDTLNTFIESDCGFMGSPVCVQETVYKKNVKLPPRSGGYILSYQRCCRNETLNNIFDPLNAGSTYFVEIKEAALTTDCNSSPVFNQWPDIYICANEALTFDHSATDADGDMLVYSLCVPSDGASIDEPKPQPPNNPPYGNVGFMPPYSVNDMLGGVPLVIDPNTGVITATPNLVGQFLVGICVDEYRDGELLSRVRRDFQYNVRVCGSATIASFEADSIYCGTSEITFDNTSTNADTYLWNFDFPNTDPAFISTAENPTFNYSSPGTYTVVLEATRASDGCTSSFSKTIVITDDIVDASFTATAYRCQNNDEVFLSLQDMTSINMGMSNITSIDWVVTQSGVAINLSGPTVTTVLSSDEDITINLQIMTSSGCQAVTTQTVAIDDIDNAISFDVVNTSCNDDLFNYTISATDIIGFTSSTYAWTVVTDGATSTFSGNPISFQSSDNMAVITVSTTIDPGCEVSYTETLNLGSFNPEVMLIPSFSSCNANGQAIISLSAMIDASSSFVPVSYDWSITSGNSNSNFTGNPIMFPLLGNEATVDLTITSDNGCEIVYTDQVLDLMGIVPTIGITTMMSNCSASGEIDLNLSAQISAVTGFTISSIDWSIVDGNNTQNFMGNPVIATVNQNESVDITATVNFENGCSLSVLENLETSGGILIDYTDGNILCKSDTLLININGQPDYSYLWEDHPFIVGGNNTPNPFVQIPTDATPGTYTLNFSVSNNSGCTQDYEYTIIIEAHVILMSEVASLNCETYEVCFNNISSEITNVIWEFADDDGNVLGSTNDANPCITFPGIGIYHITLSGVDETCAGIPFILCVTFADYDIEIDNYMETISACPGESVTLTAMSSLDDDEIMWCDIANPSMPLAMGNTLTFVPTDGQQVIAKVLDDNSCASSSRTTTFNIDNIDLGSYSGTLDICAGDVYQVDLFNSLTGLEFEWLDHPFITMGNMTASPTITIPMDALPSQETLDFTVTNENNCSEDFTLILNIIQTPDFSFTWDLIDCDLITVCFTNTSGTSSGLLWDFGDPNSSTDISTAENPCYTYNAYGNYIVTLGTAAPVGTCSNASNQINVSIVEPTLDIADISISGENYYCQSGDVNLTAIPSGPGAITWFDQNGGILGSGLTLEVNPIINEIVSVGYTDQFGCESALQSTTLTDGSLQLDIFQPLTLCAGDSGNAIVLTGQDVTYLWEDDTHIISGNDTADPVIQIDANEPAGSFTLNFTATNQFGCTDDFTYEVVILDSPELSFDFTIDDCEVNRVCFTNTSAMSGILIWNFGDPSTTNDISADDNPCYIYPGPGVYEVILNTVSNNCMATPDTMIIELFDLDINIDHDSIVNNTLIVCDTVVELSANVSMMGLDITWCDTTGMVIGTGDMIEIPVIDSTQVVAKVTDTNGCLHVSDILTILSGTIDLEYESPLTICRGDTLILDVMPTTGLIFDWEDSPYIIAGDDSATPTIYVDTSDMTTGFTLNFTAANAQGCLDSFEYDIIVTDNPVMSFDWAVAECDSLIVCFENTSSVSGNLFWDFGDLSTEMDTSSLDNPCYTYPAPGAYVVTLTTTAGVCAGVKYTDTIVIEELPVITFGGGLDSLDQEVCIGDTLNLMASSNILGNPLQWCNLDSVTVGSGNSIEIVVTQDTSLVIKAFNDNGCFSRSDTIDISVFQFDLELQNDPVVICPDNASSTTATIINNNPDDNLSYLWSPAECILTAGNSSSEEVTAEESKDLLVTVTSDLLGCSTELIVPLKVSDLDISVTDSVTIILGEEVTIEVFGVENGDTVLWDNGSTEIEQTLEPDETTIYTVTVTDECGCQQVRSVVVTVLIPRCDEDAVFVPTAFTPNDDGVNDVLFVRSLFLDEMELIIYNRWGEEIFKTVDMRVGWDGTYKGNHLSPDVYAYCLRAVCVNGEESVRTGNISLMR